MPLFRKEPERAISRRPVLTINGRPQPVPETPDTIERRSRLFVECERRLADDPLTQEAACGQLVGDGNGLEGLVARIAPLFEREQSLIRWVALRGAFTHMYGHIFAPDSSPNRATRSPEELAEVMGLAWADATSQSYTATSTGKVFLKDQEPASQMPGELRNVALALATMTTTFAAEYDRLPKMTIEQVNADSKCSTLNDIIALDCIAWSAVALLRLGLAQLVLAKIAEPDALPEPGWYTDPLFGKFERRWDGSDWTSACRRQEGRRFAEFTVPLR
jgi:Protein of unknown function (DUF2510)